MAGRAGDDQDRRPTGRSRPRRRRRPGSRPGPARSPRPAPSAVGPRATTIRPGASRSAASSGPVRPSISTTASQGPARPEASSRWPSAPSRRTERMARVEQGHQLGVDPLIVADLGDRAATGGAGPPPGSAAGRHRPPAAAFGGEFRAAGDQVAILRAASGPGSVFRSATLASRSFRLAFWCRRRRPGAARRPRGRRP